MARPLTFDPASLDDAQREVYDAIRSGPRGMVQGPLRIWLESPGFAQLAQSLGEFCRFGTSLHPRLSELAILVTGAHWQAEFEWHVHAPLAMRAGIDAGIVEAIRAGREPVFTDIEEQVVYSVASELLRDRSVSDATYLGAEKALGVRQLVELVGVLGYYALISMTIRVFEVPLPSGAKPVFGEENHD